MGCPEPILFIPSPRDLSKQLHSSRGLQAKPTLVTSSICLKSQHGGKPKATALSIIWIAERVFDWSGLSVTHLRPTFFAEWFLYYARDIKDGLVKMGFSKDGKHAPIAAEDQARVIVSILENPGPHAGKSYPLFGPKEYTYPEAFAEIGRILNHDIRYEEIPPKAFEERIAKTRSPFLAQHLVEVAKDHAAGVFSGTNDLVKRITGKEPMGLKEFVEKNKRLFETGNAPKVIAMV